MREVGYLVADGQPSSGLEAHLADSQFVRLSRPITGSFAHLAVREKGVG